MITPIRSHLLINSHSQFELPGTKQKARERVRKRKRRRRRETEKETERKKKTEWQKELKKSMKTLNVHRTKHNNKWFVSYMVCLIAECRSSLCCKLWVYLFLFIFFSFIFFIFFTFCTEFIPLFTYILCERLFFYVAVVHTTYSTHECISYSWAVHCTQTEIAS